VPLCFYPILVCVKSRVIFTFTDEQKGITMLVEVRNGDINRALKDLKKKVYRERILIEYKQRMAYEKPSEKKRRKKAESVLRRKKDQEKQLEAFWE
jgi:small subunit ribosomal protein S21